MNFDSLAKRIFVFIIPTVVITTISFVVFSYHISNSQINNTINEKMYESLQAADLKIQLELAENAAIAVAYANYGKSMNAEIFDQDGLKIFLTEAIVSSKNTCGGGIWFEPYAFEEKSYHFGPYVYAGNDGEVVYVSDYGDTVDYFNEGWYVEGKQSSGELVWSKVYYDPVADITMVTATKAFYDKTGNFLGVGTADMDLKHVRNIINNISVGETGKAFILGSNGEYISFFDEAKSVDDMMQSDKDESLAQLGKELMEKKSGITEFVRDGKRLRVYYMTMDNVGWRLAVAVEDREINSSALTSFLVVTVIPIVGLLFVILGVWRIIEYLRRIVSKVNKFADLAASGDFSKRIEVTEVDEFGFMEEHLNTMISNMDEMSKHSAQLLKIAEEASKAKSEFLSRMSREMGTPMLVINDKSQVEYISKSLMEWFDCHEEQDVMNRFIMDLPISEELKELFADVFERGEFVQKNIEFTKDGEQQWFMLRSSLLGNDNLSRVFELVNITELVEAKNEAELATRAKNDFLAKMSHEIRTPMNAIIGMSELLQTESLNDRQKGYVTDINISAHSLLNIINDILDLSKIEAGKMELVPIDYDFGVFINNIHSMFDFVTKKKGIDFILETKGDIPKCLYGDDVRLRQILTNICSNAVKFTSAGYVMMTVKATDDLMIFEVKDTGMGIHEEDLQKLFKPFVQADSRKNRHITGTGLGLSISKNFAEMMGGDITVSSVYGEGTTFSISIPKVLGNESTIAENKTKNEQHFYAPSADVLVVDDNEVNLKVAKGLLNLNKIDIDTASSGKDAIELVKAKDYDIVFMDHMMPEMDGIETTQEIRNLGGKYERLTVIALTANAIQGAKEMFISHGFNGFISKPIEITELNGILHNFLPPEKIEIPEELTEQKSDEFQAQPQGSGETTGGDFLEAIKQISGINATIGLSYSGIEEIYRETTEVFYKKLPDDCDKMEGFLNGEDLRNLSILAHAIKSSLATIGAMALSETAAALENASKEENIRYCRERLPGFVSELRKLRERLETIFPDKKIAPRTKGDVEYLRESVLKALAAANEFDSNLAIDELNKALEYDFDEQTNLLLETSKNALNDFNFDAAIEFLNKIIEA